MEVSTFAAPLACDCTFGANYAKMGRDTFTVRYQHQYDVVPFLPYYPTFGLLAAAERRFKGGVNTVVAAEKWPSIENDYVVLGALRYLGDNCVIETGRDGEQAATAIFGVCSTVSLSTPSPRRIRQRAVITPACAARLRLSLSVSKRVLALQR